MRYGEVVSRSFDIFWRHRYLWLLGALGGAEGARPSYVGNVGNVFGNVRQGGPPSQLGQWLTDALPLLVVLGALVVLFVLAYFIVSCVATGALVWAAAEHDAERPFGLSLAWRAGLRTFGSILGLRLLVLLLGLAALAIDGGLFVAGAVSAMNDQVTSAAAAFILGGMLLLLLIPVAIAVSIVFVLAVRAIVLEQLGLWPALGRGVQLLSARLGRVLLVWLLGIALGLGVSLAVGVVVTFVALPFVAVAGIGYAVGGVTGLLNAGSVLLVIFIIAAVLLGGAAGSYLSIYWTLAFRRLEIDQPRPAYAYPPA